MMPNLIWCILLTFFIFACFNISITASPDLTLQENSNQNVLKINFSPFHEDNNNKEINHQFENGKSNLSGTKDKLKISNLYNERSSGINKNIVNIPSYLSSISKLAVESFKNEKQTEMSLNNELTSKLADYFMKMYISSTVNKTDYSTLHECPPCFNCNLDMFRCLNNGDCSNQDGRCSCIDGFGGARCEQPLCDSPVEGDKRAIRKDNEKECKCTNDYKGINCNICTKDSSCTPIYNDENDPGVCFSSVVPIIRNNLECQVTNKAILDQINGKIPEITYSCDSKTGKCDFQFWIEKLESFYCGLWDCESKLESSPTSNKTDITCNKMKCGCYPNRPLCDPNGMDLSEWFASDDDEEGGPSGPGNLSCVEHFNADGKANRICTFSEPHMNKLISGVFGDDTITLNCPLSGECLPRSAVPNFGNGDGNGDGNDDDGNISKRYSTLAVIIMCTSAIAGLVGIVSAVIYSARSNAAPVDISRLDSILEDEEIINSPLNDMKSTSLSFHSIGYHIPNKSSNNFFERVKTKLKPKDDEESPLLKNTPDTDRLTILESVNGYAGPGEVLAIMGGSGAGKSTLLDILANRYKSGILTGTCLINGEQVSSSHYRSLCGFVDQEDNLMETSTVFEAIYFSASLRLPQTMSTLSKKNYVFKIMEDLGIINIANRTIGGPTIGRGISGGEKRRVSIACELVTSPSIIFLDEPTSGLDSYSAYTVVQTLSTLAKRYGRTIILTIHQPRSNIYNLFDSLILLSKGNTVYSGPAHKECFDYFSSIGYDCPKGVNIADFLVDISMGNGNTNFEEFSRNIDEFDHGNHVVNTRLSVVNRRENMEKQIVDLCDKYKKSNVYNAVVDRFLNFNIQRESIGPSLTDDIQETAVTRANDDKTHKLFIDANDGNFLSHISFSNPNGAGFWVQFYILSGRTFKNLYRHPALIRAQYGVAIVMSLICGFFFYGVDNSLSGFQNRMGVFFFICAIFGFGCLSSMQAFSAERHLFKRERANGYYNPTPYFVAKVILDLIPLRMIPPILFSLISYHLIGLREDSVVYLIKFISVLVLYNIAAACCCLTISIIFSGYGVSILVATLVMLFEMLFGGMLINHAMMNRWTKWIVNASFFNAAWESLLVNEVLGLTLIEKKFNLSIKVPGALILETFGLNPKGYYSDLIRLALMSIGFLIIGYIWLKIFVRERK